MDDKILVELIVPKIEKRFDLYLPINKKIGNVIGLLNKAISELSKGCYVGDEKTMLYNSFNGEIYSVDVLVRETNIRNGSILVLL